MKRAANRRGRLIETAIELFSERPYADVSVHDIASGAGVATGLLYHHFTDKEGLYLAALETLAEQLRERVESAAARPDAPVERVRAALKARVAFAASHPGGYRELVSGSGARTQAEGILARERHVWMELAGECAPPETRGAPSMQATLKGWLAFADGVQLAWLQSHDMSRAELVELCLRVLLASIDTAIGLERGHGGSKRHRGY